MKRQGETRASRVVSTLGAPTPAGAYSQGVRTDGSVYVAGQAGIDPMSGALVAGDIAAQTRQALRNVEAIVSVAGGSLRDVVKVNVYLRRMEDFPRFNTVFGEFFPHDQPARTTVQTGLAAGLEVELDAVAVFGHDGSDEPESTSLPGQTSHDPSSRLRRLYTPLISDVLDSLGLYYQVLDPAIGPVGAFSGATLAGRAFSGLIAQTDEWIDIDELLRMVDHIPQQSVVVMGSEGEVDAAIWGGLLSAAAQARGAGGAVVDGSVRDIRQINRLGFPVFGRSPNMRDIRRRGVLTAFDTVITCGGVRIEPGDYVMADANGVVAIPAEQVDLVLEKAEEWRLAEDDTESALRNGQEASTVYQNFGRI
jgi:4-hydroxy-4-methyl-2-oxoglutarate aldolase